VKSNRFLLALLLAAAVAAFWFLGKPDNTNRLGNNAHTLTSEILKFGPRPPGSESLNQVRSLLSKELEAAGWTTELQEFERDTTVGKVKFANLRARFRNDNQNPWQRKIDGLLCAHVDSKLYKDKIFLGADDAASACAALVVIAKQLATEKPDQAAKLELIFFDGEEAFSEKMTLLDGLYGSRHYANTWRTRDDKPTFGILLDMIGHKKLKIRIPADAPKHLAALMFSIAEKQNVSSHFGTAAGSIMDDHVPLNLINIPTLNIIGDFSNKPWWHTPGDNVEIISPESLSISIGVTLGMLDSLLSSK
jgi:glutaminyl-peptide cyclotransferase